MYCLPNDAVPKLPSSWYCSVQSSVDVVPKLPSAWNCSLQSSQCLAWRANRYRVITLRNTDNCEVSIPTDIWRKKKKMLRLNQCERVLRYYYRLEISELHLVLRRLWLVKYPSKLHDLRYFITILWSNLRAEPHRVFKIAAPLMTSAWEAAEGRNAESHDQKILPVDASSFVSVHLSSPQIKTSTTTITTTDDWQFMIG